MRACSQVIWRATLRRGRAPSNTRPIVADATERVPPYQRTRPQRVPPYQRRRPQRVPPSDTKLPVGCLDLVAAVGHIRQCSHWSAGPATDTRQRRADAKPVSQGTATKGDRSVIGPLQCARNSCTRRAMVCASAVRTCSIVMRSKTCWKNPATISRVASLRVNPRLAA